MYLLLYKNQTFLKKKTNSKVQKSILMSNNVRAEWVHEKPEKTT